MCKHHTHTVSSGRCKNFTPWECSQTCWWAWRESNCEHYTCIPLVHFDGIHAEDFLPGFPYSNLPSMMHPCLYHRFFTLFLCLYLSESTKGTWHLYATCNWKKKILSWMWQFSHFQVCSIFKICVGQGCLEEPGRDCSMPLGGGPDGLQHEPGGPRGRMSGSWPPETSIPGVTCWLHLLKQITTTDVSFFFIFTEPSQIYFQMQRIFLYNLCINITKCNWGCLEIPSVWWENGILALKENSQ